MCRRDRSCRAPACVPPCLRVLSSREAIRATPEPPDVFSVTLHIGGYRSGPERIPRPGGQDVGGGADESGMFVEGVRLFVVVLGTAAGFWAARTFGTEVQGIGGMLGCLLGYVSG